MFVFEKGQTDTLFMASTLSSSKQKESASAGLFATSVLLQEIHHLPHLLNAEIKVLTREGVGLCHSSLPDLPLPCASLPTSVLSFVSPGHTNPFSHPSLMLSVPINPSLFASYLCRVVLYPVRCYLSFSPCNSAVQSSAWHTKRCHLFFGKRSVKSPSCALMSCCWRWVLQSIKQCISVREQ